MSSSGFTSFTEYEPSEIACVFALVIFVILLVAHVFQAAHAKILYTIPLIVATALEVIGYVTREYSIHSRHSMFPYIISQAFIIMSPALLAANLYMFVGRAMVFVGRGYTLMRPGWITPVFVGCDILAIITQASGSGLIFGGSGDLSRLNLARAVLIAGLFIQVVAFTVFLLITLHFDLKTTRQLRLQVAFLRPFINAFYISGGMILIRSIYRAIEFISVDFTVHPITSYLYTTEWPFYILDALPIAVAIVVYNLYYPGKYLPRSKGETLSSKSQRDSTAMTRLDNSDQV